VSAALDGLRVLDFSAMISGPYCTRLMADLGAEVIKVEPPEGDHMRSRQPLREGADGSHSAYYGNLNAGKQSLCLDLGGEAGGELARALAARCDVVVENFRPGVMQRLGLDYAALAKAAPRLVYCSISGFGQSGEDATRAAYAMIVHARSGYDLANLGYQEGLERPLRTGVFVADVLGGALAFGAINAALLRRERSGEGEYVDLAMMDTMLGMLPYETAAAQFADAKKRLVYRPTRARDGFVIICPVSAGNFADMARAAGRAEWLADPRFATRSARDVNWDALMDALDDWAADKSAAECEAAMTACGVPCSRYYSVGEAMALPYCAERGLFSTVTDGAGEFQSTNAPFRMARGGIRPPQRVAKLGEHNRRIARELLGRSDADIGRLYAESVLSES
jgi:crotonobetainyl-CoA:carnitine CoA-transferase CaiB-like acyl-CoA transferase